MSTDISKNPIKSRVDFVLVFSVENANPNGDPGYDNRPRIDGYTGYGFITDVCLKRKIRNRIEMMKELTDGYDIWVRSGTYLRDTVEKYDGDKKKLCDQFFDIRAFGGVLTGDSETGEEEGGSAKKAKAKKAKTTGKSKVSQIRGPVSIQYAKSVERIIVEDDQITRICPTRFDPKKPDKQTEMGRKKRVPFAVYVAKGSVSARLAEGEKGTGFSGEDLKQLKEAVRTLFQGDESTARPIGSMIMQEVVFFTHKSKDGDEPVHKTLDRLKVVFKPDKEVDKPQKARNMQFYPISLDLEGIPSTVKVDELDVDKMIVS